MNKKIYIDPKGGIVLWINDEDVLVAATIYSDDTCDLTENIDVKDVELFGEDRAEEIREILTHVWVSPSDLK